MCLLPFNRPPSCLKETAASFTGAAVFGLHYTYCTKKPNDSGYLINKPPCPRAFRRTSTG